MDKDELRSLYEKRFHEYLSPIAESLIVYINDLVKGYPRIDRVTARPKSIESFMKKADRKENGKKKYDTPLDHIQDQIGARIITFYLDDLERIREEIREFFPKIEEQEIQPDNPEQFDYEGVHFILFIPEDIRDPSLPPQECPLVFELQIKTMYQHAWAEANHDLSYKNIKKLTHLQERKVAFTAAQTWGADLLFSQLANELIL